MPITPSPPYPKSRSDVIRSQDWNQLVDEVIRLDNAKVRKAGDGMTGPLTISDNVGIGTTSPENAEGWNKVLDVLGAGNAKLSVRTATIDARVLAHDSGFWGAPAGMVIGTRTAHSLSFGTNATTRLTINNSGNVGIGTVQPGETLEVNGRIKSGALTIGPWPASPSGYVFIGTNALDQSNAANYALLQSRAGSDIGTTYLNSPTTICLRIGNAEKMVIVNNGNVGIGESNPGYKLDVNGRMRIRQEKAGDLTAGIWFSGYNRQEFDAAFVGMATANQVGFYGNVGTPNWRLLVATDTGNLTLTSGTAFKPGGGSWSVPSDERLKKNIRPLAGALDKLLQLRGILYEWKNPEEQGNLTGPQMGLLAQDVEAVFPEWVDVDTNGYKALTIRGFEALAIEAFKTLKAENEALKKRCEELETKLQQIEGSKFK